MLNQTLADVHAASGIGVAVVDHGDVEVRRKLAGLVIDDESILHKTKLELEGRAASQAIRKLRIRGGLRAGKLFAG